MLSLFDTAKRILKSFFDDNLFSINDILSKTKIGKVLKFERLIVKPILCWKSYPEENPENKLLVKIYEVRGKNKKLLFYGWIFSSTPSISGLEHQFYDVVLKNCFNKDNI